MMVRYSLSVPEACAFSQIFASEIDSTSPFRDLFEKLQAEPSAEKIVGTVKSRILAEGSASKALESIFSVLKNPQKLYTVFIRTRSDIEVFNFFENDKIIAAFSNEGPIVHLDSTMSRDDLANLIMAHIGETSANGAPLRFTSGYVEFLALSAASALSRTSSDDQTTNLLGEAPFTREMLLRKFKASEDQVFNVSAEVKASLKDEGVIGKAIDSLIQKGVLKPAKSGVSEYFTIDDDFTEITNVLSSPDYLVSVWSLDFGGSVRCSSFVKSWDKELISIVSSGRQTVDSPVSVERRFSSGLRDFLKNSLFNVPDTDRVDTADEQNAIQRGLKFIQAGEFGEAVNIFHEALRTTPDDSDVWYWLGLSYQRMNLLFDAIRSFKKAVNLDSDNAKAWFDLGSVYYQMEDYPEAATCFSKITEINPEPYDAWFWAGLSYGNYGEFELAGDYLSQAARRKPDDPQVWYSLGQASVAMLNQTENEAEAKKRAKSALQYLKKAQEKGIEKIIPEEAYTQLTVQVKQLADFVASSKGTRGKTG
jgi:tetratricopeptide (TPR) repeat protein